MWVTVCWGCCMGRWATTTGVPIIWVCTCNKYKFNSHLYFLKVVNCFNTHLWKLKNIRDSKYLLLYRLNILLCRYDRPLSGRCSSQKRRYRSHCMDKLLCHRNCWLRCRYRNGRWDLLRGWWGCWGGRRWRWWKLYYRWLRCWRRRRRYYCKNIFCKQMKYKVQIVRNERRN